MITFMVVAIVLLVVLVRSKDRDQSGSYSGDLSTMQGTWKLVHVDHQCPSAPKDDELIAITEFVVKDDSVTRVTPGTDNQTVVFRLDSSKSPKEIDFLDPNENRDSDRPRRRAKGIYKIESGTIVLALALDSGDDRPTEFQSRAPKNPRAEVGGVAVIRLRKK